MATYQSLYRRYRSQRFDEVLGQDHITRALRNAVREGRVGHAYLFSGPRGTGKTSTARILAKVLNCANPEDGEPCGVCDNCVAVAEGRVTDWLLEQDAASKSKVDDMRDLLERVPLGTSGNRKVIILDEVHMLSQGAENALLKTLEEPPDHVVFVLATTDPQKVRPTIRSRTQSFEFHLLPPDVMAEHVRHVIDDAALGLGDDAVDHVVRLGGGSARDTLSALDQVAALGEVVSDREPVDAVVDALCDRDAGAALVAVADALAVGRDPRTLGEDVIAALRNAFLSVMGVGDTHLAPVDRGRAADVGQRLGAAGLTRALDVLGEALTELARKPDPRIVVEVALVRLTRPDADRSLDAVLERLDRLEHGLPAAAAGTPQGRPSGGGSRAAARSGPAVADAPPATTVDAPEASAAPAATSTGPGGTSVADARAALAARRQGAGAATPKATPGPSGAGPAPSARATDEAPAPGPAEAPRPASGESRGATTAARSGTPTLGAVNRRRSAKAPEAAGDSAGGQAASPAPPATADPAPGGGTGPGASGPPATGPAQAPEEGQGAVGPAQVTGAWQDILAGLPISVRSKWRAGRWLGPDGGGLRFAVDNEWHQKVCEDTRRDVEQALKGHFGETVAVAVVVDGGGPGAPGAAGGRSGGGRGPAGGAGTPPPAGGRGASQGRGPAGPPDDMDENIDPSELRDAGDATVGGVDLLMREFGGELVEGEQR